MYTGSNDAARSDQRKEMIGLVGTVIKARPQLKVVFPLIRKVIRNWPQSCRYLPNAYNIKKITEEDYAMSMLSTLGEASYV